MQRILTPADAAAFRNRLCETAAGLFAERGFDGFNMRELAVRLGVSAMTPYRYFKDKEEILSAVRARAFARFTEWLEKHLSAPDADDGTLSRAYVQYAIQEQSQYRLMFDLVRPSYPAPAAHSVQEQPVRRLITAFLHSLANRGLVSGDPELLSLVMWSVLHGATALYLAGKLSSQDFDSTLSNAVRLVINRATKSKACPGTEIGQDREAAWWQAKPSQEMHAVESGV